MTLALIPARGGSKGIPRKNVLDLAGKPLIAWTIEAALGANSVSRVVVTTDDAEIADIAREHGAEVPFMRPADLASDTAPGIAPVMHALGELPQTDALVLLQPTSPLRTAAHIDSALALAHARGAPSLVSVRAVEEHPAHMFRLGDNERLSPYAPDDITPRRQDLPPLWLLNGAIYFAEADWLRESGALVAPETIGFPMDARASVDIDTQLDWQLAEQLLSDRT
ncbi:MAG: acylneuraminate cytidylyltransferase family protein [Pseudomonadota bacterium]